jgi:hypothetical protein
VPLKWKDWVKMTVSAGGTGALTLGSAVTNFQAFAAGDDGLLFPYSIQDGSATETGYGTYTHSGTSFARTQRYYSSTGSALNVSTSAYLFVDLVSEVARGMDMGAQSIVPGGRLTLLSGVPVPSADVTAASNIYYTPFVNNGIDLWDGNRWTTIPFTEVTQSLAGASAAYYNVLGYYNAGALATELYLWPSATVTISNASPGVVTWTANGLTNGDMIMFTTTGALPTPLVAGRTYFVVSQATNTCQLAASPGGTAINTSSAGSGTHTAYAQRIQIQDGRYCKSGDKTRLFLGSNYPLGGTTTEDSLINRCLFNMYNRVPRVAQKGVTTSHTYNGTTERNWNNSATDTACNFMIGVVDEMVNVQGFTQFGDIAGAVVTLNTTVSVRLNATSYSNMLGQTFIKTSVPILTTVMPFGSDFPQLGLNTAIRREADFSSSAASYQFGSTTAFVNI